MSERERERLSLCVREAAFAHLVTSDPASLPQRENAPRSTVTFTAGPAFTVHTTTTAAWASMAATITTRTVQSDLARQTCTQAILLLPAPATVESEFVCTISYPFLRLQSHTA